MALGMSRKLPRNSQGNKVKVKDNFGFNRAGLDDKKKKAVSSL